MDGGCAVLAVEVRVLVGEVALAMGAVLWVWERANATKVDSHVIS